MSNVIDTLMEHPATAVAAARISSLGGNGEDDTPQEALQAAMCVCVCARVCVCVCVCVWKCSNPSAVRYFIEYL